MRVTRQHRKQKNKKEKSRLAEKGKKEKRAAAQKEKKEKKGPGRRKEKKEKGKRRSQKKMRLEGADRSRAHFEYARKYAQKGDAMSTRKAIAHFGRGMAYGAHASRDARVSNAGPYTYHWKQSHGADYTIDVAERDGGDSVATIAVTRTSTEPRMEFEASLLSQSHGKKMGCELTRRYVAREVVSVIRYAHKEKLAMSLKKKEKEEGDVKVEFDDSWGETPLDDSAAWVIADEGVFERGGCWPRLGNNKENSRPKSEGLLARAMRGLVLKGHKYTPLGDGGNRDHVSFGMIGTVVYTNGWLVAEVEYKGAAVSGNLLSKKKGESPIASFEYSVPEPSRSRPELYTDVLRFDGFDENNDHTRAYAMLAFTSLIQSLYGKTRLVELGRDKDEDLSIMQWVLENAPSAKHRAISVRRMR